MPVYLSWDCSASIVNVTLSSTIHVALYVSSSHTPIQESGLSGPRCVSSSGENVDVTPVSTFAPAALGCRRVNTSGGGDSNFTSLSGTRCTGPSDCVRLMIFVSTCSMTLLGVVVDVLVVVVVPGVVVVVVVVVVGMSSCELDVGGVGARVTSWPTFEMIHD